MAAEHQVVLDLRRIVAFMRDILQRLLDAEAARVGFLAIAEVGLMLRPVGEAALAHRLLEERKTTGKIVLSADLG